MNNRITRREALKWGLACGVLAATSGIDAGEALPEASYDKLPRWRGFNLLEKVGRPNRPFREDDFKWTRDWGFNFIRLPMDYRLWIKDDDPRRFDEKVLEEIDEAVAFGEKYGIHVNLNFHRAPGYCINPPAEPKSVWTDPETLEICASHWSMFAKRYRGISNNRLSFNLFNEPARVEGILEKCVAAHRFIIKAIRQEDPARLIICDGHGAGTMPLDDLIEDRVAQSTRGYIPGSLTFYDYKDRAGLKVAPPVWPMMLANGLIRSPTKKEIPEENRKPLVVTGPFSSRKKLRFRVGVVSRSASFRILADDATIYEREFVPGPGEGEWEKVVYSEQWKIYQNIYNREYETTVPAGTQRLEFRLDGGDWLSLIQIGLQDENGGNEAKINLEREPREAPTDLRYVEAEGKLQSPRVQDRAWLKEQMLPWIELEKKGIGVMAGEFASYTSTPHETVLRWMDDLLSVWKELGWGFALWNLRGTFGVMDSKRKDVDYEAFQGHKLDRKMLAILQKY